MAAKLPKSTFPENSRPEDFKAFGPAATKDGEFNGVMLVDLGCFAQGVEGRGSVDQNKFYHASVIQHKTTGKWYTYFEWGRTGAKNPQFQFIECSSQAEAQSELAKQCHEKNDRRGEWVDIGGLRTLRAKAGKDCYLVRPQARRSTGLPDARTITTEIVIKSSAVKKSTSTIDHQTLKLMHDLNVGTLNYTRSSMADAALPTQNAIDEARILLGEAKKRIVVVGDNVELQTRDRDLTDITSQLYGRIPKKKALRAAVAEWVLSKDNISLWEQDLDAFESALASEHADEESDPFAGMPLKMRYIDSGSALGKFLYAWWPRASANRHSIGDMRILNLWEVERQGEQDALSSVQEKLLREKLSIKERPTFQPPERYDLDNSEKVKYYSTNTGLLHHGSRTVNLSSILRTGFRFPSELVGVVITGSVYGPGAYYADDIKKSAGYTSLRNSYWSGGSGSIQGRHAFMFACDVVLGVPHLARGPYGYTSTPKGTHCVFAKGGYSGVQNNEWVIFSKPQIRIRYLIEFTV